MFSKLQSITGERKTCEPHSTVSYCIVLVCERLLPHVTIFTGTFWDICLPCFSWWDLEWSPPSLSAVTASSSRFRTKGKVSQPKSRSLEAACLMCFRVAPHDLHSAAAGCTYSRSLKKWPRDFQCLIFWKHRAHLSTRRELKSRNTAWEQRSPQQRTHVDQEDGDSVPVALEAAGGKTLQQTARRSTGTGARRRQRCYR